jgi:hypothetical protein
LRAPPLWLAVCPAREVKPKDHAKASRRFGVRKGFAASGGSLFSSVVKGSHGDASRLDRSGRLTGSVD